jgi:pyruvate kinase
MSISRRTWRAAIGILFDDGLIACEVVRVVGGDVHARVLNGGPLSLSRKGINLPGVRLSIPPFTERDAADLDFMMEEERRSRGAFVRARSGRRGGFEASRQRTRRDDPRSSAKIEKSEAVDHIEDVLDVADGVMVARRRPRRRNVAGTGARRSKAHHRRGTPQVAVSSLPRRRCSTA